MKLLISVLATLAVCSAAPRDLSGKMFTFPETNNRAHVVLNASSDHLSAATVCHRSFTDLQRSHGLFSLATSRFNNAFLVYWDAAKEELEFHINDKNNEFIRRDYEANVWHTICTTWDSASGLVQLWFDGKPSVRRLVHQNAQIRSPFKIILGQEQDSVGGGFDTQQSFVGMMSDVHMWNYVLSACEIHRYVDNLNFSPGNVLDWRALEFQIVDKVLIEDKQMTVCY